MVWDLGKALRKKEEFESARLLDFAFHQRARATRHLAQAFGLDEVALVREIALRTEDELADHVAALAGLGKAEVIQEYVRCLTQARQELIAERGDPTPHRLG